jgi:hypothetical protein
MDIMKASFPGDATAGTFKRKIERDYFKKFAENFLWIDGPMPLANAPKFFVYEGEVPASGIMVEREVDREGLDQYVERYWKESTFKYFHGEPVLLDLVCMLGRNRSAEETQHMSAFKEMSTLAIRAEMDHLLRFKHISPVSIQFFHVYDEAENDVLNFHLHTLIFLV